MRNQRCYKGETGNYLQNMHRHTTHNKSCQSPLRVLANGGIFPGIFLGISVEMVLAGLREGYP